MADAANYIFRVVERGAKAEHYDDDQETDLEGPCDLVLLTEDAQGKETEIGRKEFETGKDASDYLAGLFKCGGKDDG